MSAVWTQATFDEVPADPAVVGRGPLRPADLRRLLGIPLSAEQLTAATAPLEPGVIVAGAGSGKTTVMAARVLWLVATGAVRPDEVLGLTFTTKAAAELLARVRRALAGVGADPAGGAEEGESGDPEIATYHAFAARLLAEQGLRIGVEPGAAVLVDAGRHQLAYRTVCRTRLPLDDLPVTTRAVVRDVLDLDDALAERGVDPADLVAHDEALVAEIDGLPAPQRVAQAMRDTAARRRATALLVAEFRAAKAERDVVDFADQVRLAQVLAETRPEVGDQLRQRYRVVLLDEYQDTSVAQRRLLQALFGGGHAVTAVGDPFQAIYGWRGASVHNIDGFPEHFPRRDGAPAVRYSLAENRRSGPRILQLANDIAGPLRTEHPGVAVLGAGASDKGAGALRCALLETFDEEVAWVADRVAEAGRAGRWSDVAVLVRVGAHAVPLQRALAERAVPTQVVGATALLAMPEVVDLRCVLEVLHDPTANAALLRLLTGPRWAIGPRDLAVLGRRAAGLVGGRGREDTSGLPLDEALDRAVTGVDPAEVVSLADALDDLGPADEHPYSDEARERFGQLAREIRALRRHVGEPLVDLVHRVLEVTGLDVELAAAPELVAAQRRASVAAFADLAAEFHDLDGQVTLGAFLSWLRDAERADLGPQAPPTADREAVLIMTVHKAKGLEYPVVALPFLSDDVFPSAQGRGRWPTSAVVVPPPLCDEPVTDAVAAFPGPDGPRQRDHAAFVDECRRLDLLEETRLAYVAVTRAERLVLASGHRWGPTQVKPRDPSGYLEAVRAACLAGAGAVDAWCDPPPDGATNPATGDAATVSWPVTPDAASWRRRSTVAEAVARLARDPRSGAAGTGGSGAEPGGAEPGLEASDLSRPEPDLSPAEADRVGSWDADLDLLLDDLRDGRQAARERVVRLPDALSAAELMALADDPDRFTRDLVRPMPRRPAPAARRGTRFHAWVESRYGQQPLLEPDDLPGAADEGIDTDAALERLQAAFLDTPYAGLVPAEVEASFALVLGGRVVRGRIDAVFRHGDRWEVVDWKTGSAGAVDPLQLAVYRVAWAERAGVGVADVDAAFVLVATGEVVRPPDLPGRDDLEALLAGGVRPGSPG